MVSRESSASRLPVRSRFRASIRLCGRRRAPGPLAVAGECARRPYGSSLKGSPRQPAVTVTYNNEALPPPVAAIHRNISRQGGTAERLYLGHGRPDGLCELVGAATGVPDGGFPLFDELPTNDGNLCDAARAGKLHRKDC